MDTESKTRLLFLVLGLALLTSISASTSSIFADDEDDEIEKEGEVGEEGETITKLIATGNDKKLTTMVTVPKPPAEEPIQILENLIKEQPKIQEASATAEGAPIKPNNNATKAPPAPAPTTDKSMKLVLGDIVLPINKQSDFQLELPFSKITVQPVK